METVNVADWIRYKGNHNNVKVDTGMIPYKFTGELNYVINKMRTMQKAGYKVIKKVAHPDRTVTIHMEKKVY